MSQKTSHLWFVITLTHVNAFRYFLTELLLIKVSNQQMLYCANSNNVCLFGSETWPVRKENEVALQRTEMRMVRWMCYAKVKVTVPSKELREKLGIADDIVLIP